MKKIKSKLVSSINKLVKKTSWYKGLWNGAEKIYKLHTFGLQVVNTGSGSGMHNFNYENLPISGFNFALGPQSLVHDFNILKNYFSYFKKGCTIIIPICPFSGLIVKYNKEHNFRYYPMLHPATIQNFDENERTKAYKLYRDPFSSYPKLCIKKLIKEILLKTKKILKSKQKKITLQESADKLIKGWKAQFSISDLSTTISSNHKKELYSRTETLGEMLTFCLEREFNPVVVMPPMHATLHNQLPSVFFEQYVTPLINAVHKKSVPFLDYTKDERFADDSFYSSALFLNKSGAQYFTKQILTDLKLIL